MIALTYQYIGYVILLVRLQDFTIKVRALTKYLSLIHISNMKHIANVSEGDGNQRRLKIVYSEEKA